MSFNHIYYIGFILKKQSKAPMTMCGSGYGATVNVLDNAAGKWYNIRKKGEGAYEEII